MRCDRCACTLFSCQCPGGPTNSLLSENEPETMEDYVIRLIQGGPPLDQHGRIIGGTFDGLTPAEVLADRDAFNRAANG